MTHAVETPVAIGELIDKITILEIKAERFTDAAKRNNVVAELSMLRARRDGAVPQSPRLDALGAQLKAVNERIWELEDSIRDCERRADFGLGLRRRGAQHLPDQRRAGRDKAPDQRGARLGPDRREVLRGLLTSVGRHSTIRCPTQVSWPCNLLPHAFRSRPREP